MFRACPIATFTISSVFDTRQKVRRSNSHSGRTGPKMNAPCGVIDRQIDNPQVVHYGAYEARFLKRMRERYPPSAEDAEFVDRLINGSVNLLAVIYGKIYFSPTG